MPEALRSAATREWRRALRSVLEDGHAVEPRSPGADWRGRTSLELLGFQTRVPMTQPVISSPGRVLGPRFMAAEAAWILSGDNRVSSISPFSKKIKRFSDDGLHFFGAYGPRFVAQLPHVVETLRADPSSRQAVVQVWREAPPATRDTPCTLSWQYVVRGGLLHCLATMRSSDLMTGWPYDVVNFSMTAAAVLLSLRWTEPQTEATPFWRGVGLGELVLTAGSQHVYNLDADLAHAILDGAEPSPSDGPAPIDLAGFGHPDDLTAHLWALARREPTSRPFLRELYA